VDAYILGAGINTFGKYPDRSIADLGAEAVRTAKQDASPDIPIDEVWAGAAFGGMMLGQRIMREVGASGMPVFNIENACSSSASALSLAVERVKSGAARTALVVGVEKLTALGGGALPLDLEDWEAAQGMVMPAVYAMRAQRYIHETDCTVDDLAEIAVKNHNNGFRNPRAYWSKEITKDDVAAARMVTDPFTLLHCCPNVDGAAAVLIGNAEFLSASTQPRVKVLASTVKSGEFKNGFRDMTQSELSFRTVAAAYEQAGITAKDVGVAEVHDAFSIAEVMYYEALGLTERGQGPSLLRDGGTQIDGDIPVNPSGGLLARGHPVGATGVAQIVETTFQLQRRAGEVQITRDAEVGVTHCTGGGAWGFDHGACTVSVLGRED
jgi:acetyl-CoA acetyltransferase